MATTFDDLYEKLKATAIAHVRAFESTSGPSGNPFDPTLVYRIRTSSCPMRFHPASSMPAPFNGTITPVEHSPALLMLGALMESVKADISEVTVDVKARTVATRVTLNYVFKAIKEDPQTKEWSMEYVWFTEMDETGERIVRMEECIDAGKAMDMLDRAGKYAAENK